MGTTLKFLSENTVKPKVKKATPAETSEEDYGDVVIDSDDDDDDESAPWDN